MHFCGQHASLRTTSSSLPAHCNLRRVPGLSGASLCTCCAFLCRCSFCLVKKAAACETRGGRGPVRGPPFGFSLPFAFDSRDTESLFLLLLLLLVRCSTADEPPGRTELLRFSDLVAGKKDPRLLFCCSCCSRCAAALRRTVLLPVVLLLPLPRILCALALLLPLLLLLSP